MKRQRFLNKLHPYMEAMNFLDVIINKEIDEEIRYLSDKYPDFELEINKMFTPLMYAKKEFEAKYKIDDTIVFLFQDIEINETSTLYSIFVDNYEKDHISEKDIISAFTDFFVLDKRFKSIKEVENYLDEHITNIQVVANLRYILSHYELLLNKLKEVVSNVNEVLEPSFDKYKTLVNEGTALIEEMMKEKNITDVFDDIDIPVSVIDNNNVEVYPTFILPNTVSFYDINGSLVIRFGTGILKVNEFKMQGLTVNRNKLLEVLKALSDDTKFQILELLKKHKMYGQEIAKELGLATSTISYHLNVLVNLHIVNLIKDGKKIYYIINNKQLTSYLNEIEEYLSFFEN